MEVCQSLAETANNPCRALKQLGLMLTQLR